MRWFVCSCRTRCSAPCITWRRCATSLALPCCAQHCHLVSGSSSDSFTEITWNISNTPGRCDWSIDRCSATDRLPLNPAFRSGEEASRAPAFEIHSSAQSAGRSKRNPDLFSIKIRKMVCCCLLRNLDSSPVSERWTGPAKGVKEVNRTRARSVPGPGRMKVRTRKNSKNYLCKPVASIRMKSI